MSDEGQDNIGTNGHRKALAEAFAANVRQKTVIRPEDEARFADKESFQDKASAFASALGELCDKTADVVNCEKTVVCLCGKWGSGKTTFLTEVVRQLEKKKLLSVNGFEGPIDANPPGTNRILYFNPWLFPTQEALVEQFFLELEDKFKGLEEVSQAFGNLRRHLKPIGTALAKAGAGYAARKVVECMPDEVGEVVIEMAEALGGVELRHEAPNSVLSMTKAKERLRKRLSSSSVEARLVIIDNLDRLPKDQICLIFWLIGAVMDLPKLVFLVVCDRDIIHDALNPRPGAGESFEDKIIGAYVDLPLIDLEDAIRRKSIKDLESNISDKECELFSAGLAAVLGTYRHYNKALAEQAGRELMMTQPGTDKQREFSDLNLLIDAAIHTQFPKTHERFEKMSVEERTSLLDLIEQISAALRNEEQERINQERLVNRKRVKNGEIKEEINTVIDKSKEDAARGLRERDNVGSIGETKESQNLLDNYLRLTDTKQIGSAEALRESLVGHSCGAIENEVQNNWLCQLTQEERLWLAFRLKCRLRKMEVNSLSREEQRIGNSSDSYEEQSGEAHIVFTSSGYDAKHEVIARTSSNYFGSIPLPTKKG